jgi:hypothetical protein
MEYKSYLFLPVICMLAGCSYSRSVLCVAPKGEFKPQSESELLAELNSQLPFAIPQKNFIAKMKTSGLVGWAVVQNEKQKDVAKSELKKSTTLKLLQVESQTPEFKVVMKEHKRNNQ